MLLSGIIAAAGDTAPAGGAAIGQIVIASVAAIVVTTVLLVLGFGHRSGRVAVLGRVADVFAREMRLPRWAALPSALASGALLTALFGMYWDISLHIDDGRDPGPLANPAHYFILAGLFGIFSAGFLAVVLPEGKPSRAAIRLAPNWYAPLGGVLLLSCGAFSLSGFPLDDVWHRLFGQDVTLWGPTHLMLIGGAGLALIGSLVLLVEGVGAKDEDAPAPAPLRGLRKLIDSQRLVTICGGFLIGMSTFQAEFDFGVPQFRMVFQPILIAVAAALTLVCARIYAGRGAALLTVLWFWIIRGGVTLLVGPLLGESTAHLPLYVVEALVVEAAAFAVSPASKPYRFGALSGIGIATLGFASEYGWSHVWMPIAWPARLIGESLVLVPVAAVAAGVVGAFVGTTLRAPNDGASARLPRPAIAGAGLLAICAVVAVGLNTSPARDVRAHVALTTLDGGPHRTVSATVRIDPPSAARDADWLTATAWQGKGKLIVDKLQRIAPGVYRTTQPIPVSGTWKSLVRLHKGNSLVTAPIYMPADSAIPAKEIPATARFDRTFLADKQVLQREAKSGVSGSLWAIGYTIVGLIAAGLTLLLGWGMVRLTRASRGEDVGGRKRRAPRPAATRPASGATA
jgi:hypothetical protein